MIVEFTINGFSEDLIFRWNEKTQTYVDCYGNEYDFVPTNATNIIKSGA